MEPEGNREIYSLEELVKSSITTTSSKSPAVFDMTKLRWMNGEYMKAMDDESSMKWRFRISRRQSTVRSILRKLQPW